MVEALLLPSEKKIDLGRKQDALGIPPTTTLSVLHNELIRNQI